MIDTPTLIKALYTLTIFLCAGYAFGWWWRGRAMRSEPKKPKPDNRLNDAFGLLIRRSMQQSPNRNNIFVHDLIGGTIRGVPVGSWRITVEPIPTPEEDRDDER